MNRENSKVKFKNYVKSKYYVAKYFVEMMSVLKTKKSVKDMI